MMIINGKNITKEYGSTVILDRVSFHINQGDHVGLVGRNGAGKTTLLNILAQVVPRTSGDLFVAQGKKIGYLKQKDDYGDEETPLTVAEKIFEPLKEIQRTMDRLESEIAGEEEGPILQQLIDEYDHLLAQFKEQGGYTYPGEIQSVLKGMGFGEHLQQQLIRDFSGGEKTRLAMALLLLEKPDVFLLDEPTNHLDIGTLKWLEQHLSTSKTTMLVASHDRYFLNRISNRIMEVEHHGVTLYQGNYDQFVEKKNRHREEQRRRMAKQKKEIKKQEELIRRFKSHGTEKLAKRAASREKKLEKMEAETLLPADSARVKLTFSQEFQSGKEVLEAKSLAKSFGYGSQKKPLFSGVDIHLMRGEKIGIVGANGIGKTTLMKILMGEIKANEGTLRLGHHVVFGYYDQEQQQLNPANTVFQEIEALDRGYSGTEIRKLLGRFLFFDEEVFLPVASLSGGEKARLALLKLMIGGANVLLLDEPTNHLDISSKEVVEEALMDFPGTVVAISHDRYFLNRVPQQIYELHSEGIRVFQGGYDYYQEKKDALESAGEYVKNLDNQGKKKEKGEKKSALLRQEKKEQERRARREKREKERLEQEIARLETVLSEKENQMCDCATRGQWDRLTQLEEEAASEKEKLEEAYEKWLQYDRQ